MSVWRIISDCPNQPDLSKQLKTHIAFSMFPILDTNLWRREKHRGTLTVSMMQISQLFSRLFLRLERAILEKNALDKVAPEIVFQSKDGAIFSSIAKLMMFSIVMIF